MSFFDKIASSIMPPESPEDRANARTVAEACAGSNDWLAMILDHHRQIEAAFNQALTGAGVDGRRSALKKLGLLLTAHANAEESVVYPQMAGTDQKSHAAMAYEEQATAKIEMALLEKLDPMSEEWRDKLEHIMGAVQHHVYEEEGTWFPELQQKLSAGERQTITARYTEEFRRNSGANDDNLVSYQMAAQSGHPGQMEI